MQSRTHKKTGSTHKLRIIGGQFKRTPIQVIDSEGLRPTPDRVRETLFNWLGHWWANELSDKHLLDPFAGTGAMGFEALSRGMASATLIEKHKPAIQAITALKQKLDLTTMTIIHSDSLKLLPTLTGQYYQLITLDPPFGVDWIPRILPLITPLQQQGDLLYVESEQKVSEINGYHLIKEDKAGMVFFQLFEKLGE